MDFDTRISLFHSRIRDENLCIALLDPAPFRLARRAGIKLRPPLFQPMWLNLLGVFTCTDIPLTMLVVAWPALYPEAPLAILVAFGFIATIASGALALALSLTWQHYRARLKLPGWRDYGADEGRERAA